MNTALGRMRVRSEADVFAARRQVRSLAQGLGFDSTDQVRIAIAISELGRVLVGSATPARLSMDFDPDMSALVIDIGPERGSGAATGWDETGIDATRRLMDEVALSDDPRPGGIRLIKRLTAAAPTAGALARMREEFETALDTSPLADLQAQNEELLRTLEEVRANKDELVRLNDELQETNRGVMAMYSQLSSELEETNRGVVALYAELDERGAQLREANHAKSRFLANVSHELRSPLNSVVALARILREPDSDPVTAEQDTQLQLIQSSARQLLGMVNDLLDLAKAEAGRLEPVVAETDVAGLLNDLRAGLRPVTPAAVALDCSVPDDLPSLWTDPALLGQVLRNLMSNALKFTEAGEVAVTVASTAGGISFEVRDTGIGIAAEHVELVFEEFYQVPGPLQITSRGTGLGLPYAARVVDTLGGRLEVSSTPGRGSTFTFTLPLGTPVAGVAAGERLVGSVLVVDDDPAIRMAVLHLLGGHADEVLEAHSAASALHVMRSAAPDLVLLDLRMPDGGGDVVLAAMSNDPALADIPVVILTSLRPEEVPPDIRATRPVLYKSDLDVPRITASIRKAVAR